ncbi:hypothetical protein Cgig2_024650 [Carnegiea gigantea]|uniref:Uncharacterized protein n=1 Tax=Carnegiea gigantea TaxID=171969 RepID=A0A9Q1K900_9CARY|nr:hypothetical protein Cgig2_024650 [Carnegiea gigantea]
MRLRNRFSLCTSVVAGDEDSDEYVTGTPSPAATKLATLQSNLSLQTLPSVPSLSLLDATTAVTLAPSLSVTLSLSSSVAALSLSADSLLLYAAAGHQINVYDAATLAHIDTFNSDGVSAGAVKSVVFSNAKVLTAHQDGKIRVWKLVTEAKRRRQTHKLVATLPTVKDRLLSFPLPKNHVQVRRHKKRLWNEHHDAVSGLSVNAAIGTVYSVSWDKCLKLWAPSKSFKCLESITAHEDAVNAVTVSVDGVVYTGSADGRIRVWAKPGSEKRHSRVATLDKHKSAVNALALNSDGSIMFSGACDRSILVWEREDTGKYMVVSGALRGHDGAILCLINVSDFLISGSADRTVRIWRRGSDGRFACLAVLRGHLKPVKSLAARMEGENGILVFSGGLDGEIKVWRIKLTDVILYLFIH